MSGARVEEYLKHLEREGARDEQELQKAREKLRETEGVEVEQEWGSSDTNLLEFVSNSNKMVDERKYEVDEEEVMDNHSALLNEIDNIHEIFTKKQDDATEESGERKEVDRSLVKKELQ